MMNAAKQYVFPKVMEKNKEYLKVGRVKEKQYADLLLDELTHVNWSSAKVFREGNDLDIEVIPLLKKQQPYMRFVKKYSEDKSIYVLQGDYTSEFCKNPIKNMEYWCTQGELIFVFSKNVILTDIPKVKKFLNIAQNVADISYLTTSKYFIVRLDFSYYDHIETGIEGIVTLNNLYFEEREEISKLVSELMKLKLPFEIYETVHYLTTGESNNEVLPKKKYIKPAKFKIKQISLLVDGLSANTVLTSKLENIVIFNSTLKSIGLGKFTNDKIQICLKFKKKIGMVGLHHLSLILDSLVHQINSQINIDDIQVVIADA